MYFLAAELISLYTSLTDLQALSVPALQFYALFFLLDGNKSCSTGGLRGLAILNPLTIIVFISYYIIAPPFEYLFGYTLQLGVTGLWAGKMIGSSFHLLAQLYLLYCKADWEKIAWEARERIEKAKEASKVVVMETDMLIQEIEEESRR